MSERRSCRPAAPQAERLPLALPAMRIGLLGGSFNPPHEGHLHIAREALKRLCLDRLWWLVSPGNPLKERAGLPPLGQRLAAARALACDPRIVPTGLEAALGSSYTIDTLRALRRRFPATRFVWVMGADNLAQLHLWRSWRDIMRLVPVAVIDRPGWRLRAMASVAAHAFAGAYRDERDAAGLAFARPPAWTVLTVPLSDLSSTAIRARAAENQQCAVS